ncbi:SDR family NAD(P)-dependent oxidoreductase [Nocardioides ferulae]|uniref:SDR family NAD(P)-dependent oxidoreductase n=1 Tax=Nocardioides ferulae TaxID=2340821 RepID=UPI0013DDB6C3|nr:SDR family oxidoreductase [Nocardioides ferulae]
MTPLLLGRAARTSPEHPTSCVVTGAARGIGRGIAERMVARGHRVVITDVDGVAVAATAAQIGAVAGIAQDVRDPDSHRRVADEARRHGALVAWFNNAGVGDAGQLAELDDEQVRRLVEVNLLGALWGSRAALDAFAAPGGGRLRRDLVLTASLSGLGPVPGLSVYAATKAALVSLATSLRAEVPRGVGVHALCPDGVATDLVRDMAEGRGKRLVHSGGRMLTVDEVADAAVGLLGSRRVVRTLPGWRGGLIRGGALLPSVTPGLLRVFELQGRWQERRSPVE